MVSVRAVSSSSSSRRAVTSSSISRRRASQCASLAAFSASAASLSDDTVDTSCSKSSDAESRAVRRRNGDHEDGDVGALPPLLWMWPTWPWRLRPRPFSLISMSSVSRKESRTRLPAFCQRWTTSSFGRDLVSCACNRRHSSSNFWFCSSNMLACSSANHAASRCSCNVINMHSYALRISGTSLSILKFLQWHSQKIMDFCSSLKFGKLSAVGTANVPMEHRQMIGDLISKQDVYQPMTFTPSSFIIPSSPVKQEIWKIPCYIIPWYHPIICWWSISISPSFNHARFAICRYLLLVDYCHTGWSDRIIIGWENPHILWKHTMGLIWDIDYNPIVKDCGDKMPNVFSDYVIIR